MYRWGEKHAPAWRPPRPHQEPPDSISNRVDQEYQALLKYSWLWFVYGKKSVELFFFLTFNLLRRLIMDGNRNMPFVDFVDVFGII